MATGTHGWPSSAPRPSKRAGPPSPVNHGCSTQFEQLLQVNQRYAVIREEQARDFTLAWPVLRTCVRLLGEHLVATGAIEQADDVFFCTRNEVTTRPAGKAEPIDRDRA